MRNGSPRSGVPLYHVIRRVLRDGIESGRFRPGDALPTEDELAREYRVSRVTVRRALGDLASGGLIERRQGSGTFVRVRPDAGSAPKITFTSSIRDFEAIARRTTPRIIEFEYVDTPPEIREIFGRHTTERMQRALRLRETADDVLMHITTWIPEKLGRAYDSADMEREPIDQLLRRSGVRQTAGDQTVSVTLADPGLARLMRLDVGAPLIKMVSVMRDQKRRIVLYAEVLARADRFQLHTQLIP